MFYIDGNEAKIGDVIAIDEKYRGVVVVSIDRSEYSKSYPREKWEHLRIGILVNTDFGGLVHYINAESDNLKLIQRRKCRTE